MKYYMGMGMYIIILYKSKGDEQEDIAENGVKTFCMDDLETCREERSEG